MTDEYLKDKAYVLTRILTRNKNDSGDIGTVGNNEIITDMESGTFDGTGKSVIEGFGGNLTSVSQDFVHYVFGNETSNIIQGKDAADRLYGGAGDDTLVGSSVSDDDEVSDYLEGGQGYDSYTVGKDDIIYDTDGSGRVVFNDVALVGGPNNGSGFASTDGRFTYSLSGDELTVTDTEQNENITIKNFRNEDLGITLEGEVTPPASPNLTIEGDYQPIDFDVEKEGIQMRKDGLGNVITDPEKPEQRADILYGSGNADEIYAGTKDDEVYAKGGDDYINGGEGNDILEGAAGADLIEGGAGTDLINGGSGDDQKRGQIYFFAQ